MMRMLWVAIGMCVRFVAPRLALSMCDKCQLPYCMDCIDTHTCDKVTVISFCNCVTLHTSCSF